MNRSGSDTPPPIEGSVIHATRLYDVLAVFIRRSDGPILDLAGVGPGDRVLDIGTGPGYLARTAATRVGPDGKSVGLDASPEMVDRAENRARQEGSGATFVLAGAQDMPFDDSSFDVVVSRLAIHHIPKELRAQAMAEVARVLTPGGRVVLADLRTHSLGGLLHDAVRRIHGEGPVESDALAGLLGGARFTRVEQGKLGILSYVHAHRTAERE